MMMEGFLYSLEDEFLDFCDPLDYTDELDSTCSNESDQENQIQNIQIDPSNPPVKKVQQRKAANMRERKRMKSINDAFEHLRTCIPTTVNNDRRLSKVDTLRLAIRYISHLSDMVKTCNGFGNNSRFSKSSKPQEKIVLRCHFAEYCDNGMEDEAALIGHSLSWFDTKLEQKFPEHKLSAKVWIPENPTESDFINLTNYTGEYAT